MAGLQFASKNEILGTGWGMEFNASLEELFSMGHGQSPMIWNERPD
jgi:hypothetical protein